MVDDAGTPTGTLMALIPPDFFVTTNPIGAPPGRTVFAFAFLSSSAKYLARMGIDRSGADDPLVRLALAAQLCYVIGLLHKHDIVYGDLSLLNIAIATNPPRVLLLDCDSAAALSHTGRQQFHSPFFTPPENETGGQSQQDLRTDVYKLALCVLRGLVTGPGVTQLREPHALHGLLDPVGIDLVERALGTDRGARPSAKDLYQHLESMVLSSAQPPVLDSVRLGRTVMPRGSDVIVTWSCPAARQIRILGPNGYAVALTDSEASAGQYTIRPEASGPVRVEATNQHGTVSALAGSVDLYALPAFDTSQLRLPRPALGDLVPVGIPTVPAALPPRPVVTTETHPPPRLEVPAMVPLSAGHALPRTLTAAAAGIASTLQDTHQRAAERIATFTDDTLRTILGQLARTVDQQFPPHTSRK